MKSTSLTLLLGLFVVATAALFISLSSSFAVDAAPSGASTHLPDEDDGVFEVVGARIVTCAACRLNSLPRVRSFIENEAQSYPALYIEYVNGKDPELQFLDKHRRVVSTHDLSPLSPLQIVQLLNNNDIHTWTGAPTYEAPEFQETDYCVAFRQTGGCSPKGPREPQFDAPCLAYIEESRSGICQCKNGKDSVELPCGHDADTCDNICTPADAVRTEDPSLIPQFPEVEEDE